MKSIPEQADNGPGGVWIPLVDQRRDRLRLDRPPHELVAVSGRDRAVALRRVGRVVVAHALGRQVVQNCTEGHHA